MRTAAALVLAVVLVAANCAGGGDGDASEPDTPSSTATTPSTAASSTAMTSSTATTPSTATPAPTVPGDPAPVACGARPAVRGAATMTITTADGLERSYRRFVPTSHDAASPVPVVLLFHGLNGRSEDYARLTGLESLAEAEGFVLVSPQGTIAESLGAAFWNTRAGPPNPSDPTLAVDDVAFVDQLIDRLEADLCIDPLRVYATGMSNGAMFAFRLACDRADRIAAIAVVAGVLHPDDCRPSRALPILEIHGTSDRIVPWEGGASWLPDATVDALVGTMRPVAEQVGDWAADHGCRPEPRVTTVSDEVELREFVDCGAAQVVLYVVDDGGHTWPGSPVTAAAESLLGHTTTDIDAAALVWDWFERHPRP